MDKGGRFGPEGRELDRLRLCAVDGMHARCGRLSTLEAQAHGLDFHERVHSRHPTSSPSRKTELKLARAGRGGPVGRCRSDLATLARLDIDSSYSSSARSDAAPTVRSGSKDPSRSVMAPRRSSPEAAEALDGLTRQQLLSIYRAFDRASSGSTRGPKRSSSATNEAQGVNGGAGGGRGFVAEEGGGFMPEEGGGFMPEEGGGGFLPDDVGPSNAVSSASTPAHDGPSRRARSIPLRLVPRALKLLSLPSGDPEVLEIFDEVASSGSEASDSEDDGGQPRARRKGKGVVGEEREKRVGRTEFARVCAVLLQDADGADQDGDEEMDDQAEAEEEDDDAFEDEGDSGSDYVGAGSSPADRRTTRALARASGVTPSTQSVQDEESEPATKKKGKGKGRAKAKGEIGVEGKQSVKHTFALFFGDGGMVDPLTGAELDVACVPKPSPRRRTADRAGIQVEDARVRRVASSGRHVRLLVLPTALRD